jgi:radical SAM superfamily enzyme
LKDKNYIEFINQYVNCLLIGLESTSDFTLKHVSKGYRYRDIELAVDNMIQYLDRSIFLEISVILDLPYRDAQDVRDNYRRVATLKDRLDEAGFRVAVHMNILSVFPNLELLYAEDAMLKRSFDSKDIASSTGRII